MAKTLCLILGDQLHRSISSLRDYDPQQDVILMCEVMEEATYVAHHKKKIAFLFSAMRHFAAELKEEGLQVDYIRLDDKDNSGSFTGEIRRAIERHQPERVVVTFPGEYRVLEMMKSWQQQFGLPVEIRDDDRFLCSPAWFRQWAKERKQLRMEYFYREMRKKYHILLEEDGSPVGGDWNYDTENRKPPKERLVIPRTYHTTPDSITQEVLSLVEQRFGNHFGDLYPFHFAVTRQEALQALDQFLRERLTRFGDYQDAMLEGEPWMYHSHISFYLNAGLLLPMECVQAAEAAFKEQRAPLNAVEGFIRQIIGWREYVRGIYWLYMPDYATQNHLEATGRLPEFYWTGETDMNCLRQCVEETKANAYAHHIQRLMVLGNFALLAGIDPKEVNEWYLLVYADAYEWVELPNVTGMILYADGGLLGSKPYAAGGAYINRMSNYCSHCRYDVNQKEGKNACPFNYLYWDFLLRHREKFQSNPRMAMMYKTADRMDSTKTQAIRRDAEAFFNKLS